MAELEEKYDSQIRELKLKQETEIENLREMHKKEIAELKRLLGEAQEKALAQLENEKNEEMIKLKQIHENNLVRATEKLSTELQSQIEEYESKLGLKQKELDDALQSHMNVSHTITSYHVKTIPEQIWAGTAIGRIASRERRFDTTTGRSKATSSRVGRK